MPQKTKFASSASEAGLSLGSAEPLSRLRDLLREMFQLDRGDLDFGLYRIMKLKSAEISAFLDDDLLPQVRETLNLTSEVERVRLEDDIRDFEQKSRRMGFDPTGNEQFEDMRTRLAEVKKDAVAEADVYNHLIEFFSRYYVEGDFISQRRYTSGGRSAYLIPYDGEEVKLYWANADQYYIKTTENYASYVFIPGADELKKRVRFEVATADNKKDNIKEANEKQRRFILSGKQDAIEAKGDNLFVRFEHRHLTEIEKKRWPGNGTKQQERINTTTADKILNTVDTDWLLCLDILAPTDSNNERTLLDKHIERYTSKNSFDYFIHKDLGGFLHRELSLYLSTEVLNLDDIEQQQDNLRLDRALARVRAIRHIGKKIIDFLAQLEDYQKQLWLKKKFILDTQWCVTLDKVPKKMYPEIISNVEQRDEWFRLFTISEDNISTEFLEANPYLVLDTCYFDRGFKERLLKSLSQDNRLDEQMDGLLIQGDNFQALSFLSEKYASKVKGIYIDPPFNTGTNDFLYKNNYLHSSWISMLSDRISASSRLLMPTGNFFCRIDYHGDFWVRQLLNIIFGEENYQNQIVLKRGRETAGTRGKLEVAGETLYWYSAGRTLDFNSIVIDRPIAEVQWTSFLMGGERNPRERCFLGKYIMPPDGQHFSLAQIKVDKLLKEHFLRIVCRACGAIYFSADSNDTLYRVMKKQNNRYKYYDITSNKIIHGCNFLQNCVECDNDIWRVEYLGSPTKGITNLWLDIESYAKTTKFFTENSEQLLRRVIELTSNEGDIILDFFLGSGTTCAVSHKLGRKWIGIEFGDYFRTITLTRMKKVLAGDKTGISRVIKWKGGGIFKYIELESYEDTLDSIEANKISAHHTSLLSDNNIYEDYMLRYSLDREFQSADLINYEFSDPFSYTISVVRDGMRKEVAVDLPETFNYLIGIVVEQHRCVDQVLCITGLDSTERRCLILWRNLDTVNHFELDNWFKKNRHIFKSPDIIYINGDHTLNALRQPGESWIAETIEPIFKRLMFGEKNG